METRNDITLISKWDKLGAKCGQEVQSASCRELSICMTDGFCDGKKSNVTSLLRQLSGPLCVVELGGPTDDKFDACTHE